MRVNDLLLATKFAATNNIRSYLNGVYVHHNKLIGSDGHRLVQVAVDSNYEGIIPIEAVTSFVKAHKGKDITAHCQIIQREEVAELRSTLGKSQFFTPIDLRYPDFGRVLIFNTQDLETDPQQLQYRFQYLADAQKARTDWLRNQIPDKKEREKVAETFSFTWLKGRAVWQEPGLDIVVMGIKP